MHFIARACRYVPSHVRGICPNTEREACVKSLVTDVKLEILVSVNFFFNNNEHDAFYK